MYSWTGQLELEGMSFVELLHCRVVSMRPKIILDMFTDQSLCLSQSQDKINKRAGSLQISCESIERLENNLKSTEEER